MVDKIFPTDYNQLTALIAGLKLAVVDGTEVDPDNQLKWSYLPTLTNGGWTPVSDAWTYASATTVNVPSDATLTYQKCMKVRLKQGGSYKYFVCTTVAAALLTLNGGSDYSVANAAITDVAYSFIENPFGWPGWFNWTTTHSRSGTNYTNLPTTNFARFQVVGRQCVFEEQHTQNATPGGTGFQKFTLPITAARRGSGDGWNVTALTLMHGFIETGGASVSLFKYDGTLECNASEVYLISGHYEI